MEGFAQIFVSGIPETLLIYVIRMVAIGKQLRALYKDAKIRIPLYLVSHLRDFRENSRLLHNEFYVKTNVHTRQYIGSQ